MLLAPDVRDWLPEGHFAHHVSDLVDGLDLMAFDAPYEGDGRRNAPYEPRMMVKVLLYGYATGVFSSRGMARKLEEDVAFRVLGVGLLDEMEETFDAQPETVLADAGYCNERDLSELEARGIDGYVAPGREGKKTVNRDAHTHPATHRMVEKLATPAGRAQYAQRKWLSEAPNGWIKEVLGFRRFNVRGLNKARGE